MVVNKLSELSFPGCKHMTGTGYILWIKSYIVTKYLF